MRKIIAGATLLLSLSACSTPSNTMDPDTIEVSGTIMEKEFEPGSSSCTMNVFKAPGKPAPPAPKPPVKAPVVAPVKPAATGAAKPGATNYRPAEGAIPRKTYKARSYVLFPYTGTNRCYKADCWEIEFETADGQTFDVCVTKITYDTYAVGDIFPGPQEG